MGMLEIVAIVASPIIAYVVGVMVSDRKELIKRRQQIFESLWLTRGDIGHLGRMSPEHVRSLNLIEIVFARTSLDEVSGRGEACDAVIAKWNEYREFLVLLPVITKERPELLEQAYVHRDELFVELVFEMGQALGHPFDRDKVRAAYAPDGYRDVDEDGYSIRKAVRALVEGQTALHITAAPPVRAPAPMPAPTVPASEPSQPVAEGTEVPMLPGSAAPTRV